MLCSEINFGYFTKKKKLAGDQQILPAKIIFCFYQKKKRKNKLNSEKRQDLNFSFEVLNFTKILKKRCFFIGWSILSF